MKKLVVTTSYFLSDSEKLSLKDKLSATFDFSDVEFLVDESILGGIVVFDGNTVYDGSIKGKLKRASEALKK